MIRIAMQVGLPDDLDLVHEPEAAAILCIIEDIESTSNDLERAGEHRTFSFWVEHPSGSWSNA